MTHQKLRLIPDDILDQSNLETALRQSGTRVMAHFGGLQAVYESFADRPVITPM
jgi:UDP-glucose 4-epimerase